MIRLLLALALLSLFPAITEADDVADGSKLFHLTLLGSRRVGTPSWNVTEDPAKFPYTYVAIVNISDVPQTIVYHSTGAAITLKIKDEQQRFFSYNLMKDGTGTNVTVTLKPHEAEILYAPLPAQKLDASLLPDRSKEVQIQAELRIQVLGPENAFQYYRVSSEWFPFRLQLMK